MVTGLQIAILGGCLAGLGVTLLISRLLPAHVDSKWAVRQLDPDRSATTAARTQTVHGLTDRAGVLIQKRAPASMWARVPTKELAILQRPVHTHFGEKALLAVVGLMFMPLFSVFLSVIGLISLPLPIPLAGSLILAAVLFVAPDLQVRAEAKKAKRDFVHALASFVDLVALERASGTGSTQAVEAAAAVGESWVFTRLSEEFARARWAGQTPWDGMRLLSEDLDIPELADLAEILRLSRDEGATVYAQLRARSTSMRNSLLSEDLAKANAASEQMSVPVSLLALVFLAILATPALLRVAFGW